MGARPNAKDDRRNDRDRSRSDADQRLAAGGERAPRADVDALATVAVTGQRRRRPSWLGVAVPVSPRRWLILVAALIIATLALIGIGIGALRDPSRPSIPPIETAPAVVPAPTPVTNAVVGPTPWPSDHVYVQAGGGVVLRLPYWWDMATKEVTVRVPDDDGMILDLRGRLRQDRCCSWSEGGVDRRPGRRAPADGGWSRGPIVKRSSATVDGEPAVVVQMTSPVYPSNSPQVVYVAVLHDGRPYLLRMGKWGHRVTHLDDVIAGFRFAD